MVDLVGRSVLFSLEHYEFLWPILRPMFEHHIWITYNILHLISLLTSYPKYHSDVSVHFVDLDITNELAFVIQLFILMSICMEICFTYVYL